MRLAQAADSDEADVKTWRSSLTVTAPADSLQQDGLGSRSCTIIAYLAFVTHRSECHEMRLAQAASSHRAETKVWPGSFKKNSGRTPAAE